MPGPPGSSQARPTAHAVGPLPAPSVPLGVVELTHDRVVSESMPLDQRRYRASSCPRASPRDQAEEKISERGCLRLLGTREALGAAFVKDLPQRG